jgi:hypothetical protein
MRLFHCSPARHAKRAIVRPAIVEVYSYGDHLSENFRRRRLFPTMGWSSARPTTCLGIDHERLTYRYQGVIRAATSV